MLSSALTRHDRRVNHVVFHVRRVPLQRPRSEFKFRIIMMGMPFFSINLCDGIPLRFTARSTSASKKSPFTSSSTESVDRYSRAASSKRSATAALILRTTALFLSRWSSWRSTRPSQFLGCSHPRTCGRSILSFPWELHLGLFLHLHPDLRQGWE
ncbi:hypothetical protein PHMEG_00022854 [Phytophthora megakarya]|uniref:Uncharacterized protein n=1 Tax=Phytophthora megakarya TaxID=4795 RepID=A0A225VJR0_9STRA|nr:hypothetical protein PHMEG_00022854 [Phytophthora megakarya]